MAVVFRKMLVPVDGSAASRRAGKLAIELAKGCSAEVTAIHVVDVASLPVLARATGKTRDELKAELVQEGEHLLAELAREAAQAGVQLTTLVEVGTPHRVIVDTAAAKGVDLILIGKVGLRGPRRIIIGSVTERVIADAQCPVLVV
jgi:nucleotide-binding universal stress UspA family protein